ncbi:hypothetical protein [Sulfoacidibacillus ferrooxidans]|uniref:Tetratricopeptide repeat protein n=1 Tax=Sulfoacidibacillus ferrooxidans TaxID=2005001 RepID=A0A9X1V729_9BACL|nr:hypothetical protein [Sulfoacidibacillus ferrooxidans]
MVKKAPSKAETLETGQDDEKALLTEAYDVLQTTIGESDPKRRADIAQQALVISRNCIEAWLMLAQDAAENFEQSKEYLNQAVEAGNRLFALRMEEWKGKFWDIPETRPYMQARSAYAQILWEIGERDEAVRIFRESLELNRTDPQGIRYILLKAMLDDHRFQDAYDLIDSYDNEQSTVFLYGRLLAIFALQGDSLMSRSAFLAARRHNVFVLDYLLNVRQLPQKMPREALPGDESEAIRYTAVFQNSWDDVDGAIDYLRKQKKLRQDKDAKKKR